MTTIINKKFYDYIFPAKFNSTRLDSSDNSNNKTRAHFTNSYRSILALNGELPDKSFFVIFEKHKLPVIAVDGAANQLIKMQVIPSAIIGDLDSFIPDNNLKLQLIYTLDQNYCDFHKSMHYLLANNLTPAIIVGMGGGTIDHILQNISIFKSTNSIFFAYPVVGHSLHTATINRFTLPINTKISLFGIPTATISTQGLKWELSNYNLTFADANSCFNRCRSNHLIITVHDGICMVIIYLSNVQDAGTFA